MDRLQDEICSLNIKSENKPASTLDQGVPEPASNQQYDSIASKNVNIYESTYHSPNQLGGKMMQRPNTDFTSQSNRTESSSRERSNVPFAHVHPARELEQLAGDIKENPILQDIDKEIQQVAAEVRRQSQPPRTEEFFDDDNDDPSLGPYDPNLVCLGCGMRYRYGEIQKLRCHINVFCIARQNYDTQTVQKHVNKPPFIYPRQITSQGSRDRGKTSGYVSSEQSLCSNDSDHFTRQRHDANRVKSKVLENIKKNPILQNIDRAEIEHVADNIRRQTLPPQTQEFLNDDNDETEEKSSLMMKCHIKHRQPQ